MKGAIHMMNFDDFDDIFGAEAGENQRADAIDNLLDAQHRYGGDIYGADDGYDRWENDPM